MVERGPRLRLTPWLVVWVALALLAVILVAQNSGSTEVQVLGWTIQAPLFVVIVAAMAIGWGLGALGTQVVSWRRRRRVRRDDVSTDE